MRIEIDHVTYRYISPLMPSMTALEDVSLSFESGEITALVGASGSGKTTLIQHFNGLLVPTEGKVRVGGKDLSARDTDLNDVRKKVGLVFQFPENQLFEESIFADVSFGPRNLGLDSREVERRVRDALKAVGFDPERGVGSPFQLSGGEKRRIAIAGVLAMEPEVLVLDEPTVALDFRGSGLVERLMKKYHAHGRTVIFITHDMDLVGRMAERVVVLHKGRIRFDGPKERFFRKSDVLKEAGFGLPSVIRFMRKLARHYPVCSELYTVEAAKAEISRVFKAGRRTGQDRTKKSR